MVAFPNCKINFGLHVVKKRNDGYHDIETVFYPLPLNDVIELIINEDSDKILFSQSGIPVPGETNNNICIKAYELLKKDFPLPAVKIHLHKVIPAGAGLGGGSSDASFILKLANEKFGLQLSRQQLADYAFQLGSDCPFFILNKPAYAIRRGEILEEISLDLSPYKICIVNPGIHISTAEAFSAITPRPEDMDLKKIISMPVEQWQSQLYNDFEPYVFKLYPEVEQIKSTLLFNGALYASMSGSGSTVFGIFPKEGISKVKFPGDYFYKWL